MMGSVVWMLELIEVDAKIWQTFCEHFGNNLGIRQNCSISFRYMGKTFQLNICVCVFFLSGFHGHFTQGRPEKGFDYFCQ